MMDLFDQCRRETFELSPAGSAVGWRFGDLAAHGHGRRWTITHLPSGRSMRNAHCWFDSAEKAVAAMIEIAKLKNSWDFVEVTHETLIELRDRIKDIADKHGGKKPPTSSNYSTYRGGLNGYGT